MDPIEPHVLDLTAIDNTRRYLSILRTFDGIPVGERLWLVADRSPGRLWRRLRRDRPSTFYWCCARQGNNLWVIAITKVREMRPDANAAKDYWERMIEPVVDRSPSAQDFRAGRGRRATIYEQLRGMALD